MRKRSKLLDRRGVRSFRPVPFDGNQTQEPERLARRCAKLVPLSRCDSSDVEEREFDNAVSNQCVTRSSDNHHHM